MSDRHAGSKGQHECFDSLFNGFLGVIVGHFVLTCTCVGIQLGHYIALIQFTSKHEENNLMFAQTTYQPLQSRFLEEARKNV